jgi:hypothetical protein
MSTTKETTVTTTETVQPTVEIPVQIGSDAEKGLQEAVVEKTVTEKK